MEETLKRHLKTQLVDTAMAGVYQHDVKKLDKNHLIDNVAHDDLIKIENGIIKIGLKMNFLSLDAVIIPKRLEDLSHKKIKEKLIFDCDISLKCKDFIIDEFGVIDIEIYSFIANLDVFAMSKITLDKVDPPQDYLEDYNYFWSGY